MMFFWWWGFVFTMFAVESSKNNGDVYTWKQYLLVFFIWPCVLGYAFGDIYKEISRKDK